MREFEFIVKLDDITTRVLSLGFEGEKNCTRYIFDASDILSAYPDAGVSLAIKPPVGDVYPKEVEKNGTLVIWNISASECAHEGDGEYQLTFTDGDEIIKSWRGYTKVFSSLTGNGTEPDLIADWVEAANALLSAMEYLSASATTLSAGSEATAEVTDVGGHKNIRIGVPAGLPGQNGVSPVIAITDIYGGHRVTVTDAEGSRYFDVLNGSKGDDGYSPTVTITNITGGHRITITDATGDHSCDVMDGTDGDPTNLAPDYEDLPRFINKGWLCTHEGKLYKANTNITKTYLGWRGDQWDAITVEEFVNDYQKESLFGEEFYVPVEEFTPDQDVVYREIGKEYLCKLKPAGYGETFFDIPLYHLPESSDEYWEVTTVLDEFSSVNGAISELYPDATSADVGKALIVKTVANGKPETFELGEAGGGLPDTIPTEETAQELLEYETYNTGLTDTALAVIGQLFTNLPQDETLTDILHSLELECERLDLIYNGWIAERESA